jgi:hypothetical protein
MENITFINSRGRFILLGNEWPFILTKIEGLGTPKANIQNQKSPNQDGESYLGNTLDSRLIAIELEIITHDIDEMMVRRNELMKVFNPKLGEGKLIYERGNIKREAKAIADMPPHFPDAESFEDTMQPCLIQLVCHNPFLQDILQIKEEVAIWRGAFEFPLEIPIDDGIEFGFREPSLIANIENNGDVPCGMKVEFKALGSVVNPSLFNVDTREYMKINKTMAAGEILTITTHFQSKRVEMYRNGIVSNAFNWWDLHGTFLQLDVGDNLLRYDADEGLDNLEVNIWFTPQYLGV